TWWQTNGHEASPKRSDEVDAAQNLMAQFTYLLVTQWLEPKPLSARTEHIGFKRVDVVEVDANGWRIDYYLDTKTHLPIKIVSAHGPISHAQALMNQEVSLEDYAEVDGIM